MESALRDKLLETFKFERRNERVFAVSGANVIVGVNGIMEDRK